MVSMFNRRRRRLNRLKRVSCIAFDLDGTLLRSDSTISTKVLAAAKAATRCGVRIVLATGRTDAFARYYLRQLDLDTPVISLNGSLVLSSSQGVLAASTLPNRLGTVVAELHKPDASPAGVALFTETGIFVDNIHTALPGYLNTKYDSIVQIASLTTIFNQAVLAVLSGRYNTIQRYSVEISRKFGHKLQRTLYQSGGGGDLYYLEISNSRANKATGLKAVLNYMKIHPNNCAAIGDYSNDIEMCKFAGVSAAMRNAGKELKSLADIVTLRSNNEDGAAEFIRLILAKCEQHQTNIIKSNQELSE